MQLALFPLDEQTCTLDIASCKYSPLIDKGLYCYHQDIALTLLMVQLINDCFFSNILPNYLLDIYVGSDPIKD